MEVSCIQCEKVSECLDHSKSLVKASVRPRVLVRAGVGFCRFLPVLRVLLRFSPFSCVLLCLKTNFRMFRSK